MASNDWAVVVGISHYPELDDLGGPEHDARAFHDWLVAPDGGEVPPAQVQLIVSSDYPKSTSAAGAHPTVADILTAFERLHDVADRNAAAGKGQSVGRRLYIYMSGHGFAPAMDEAALLTANATRYRVGHHVPGKAYGRWFQQAGYFDEVVVFMDCSRDTVARVPLNAPPWLDILPFHSTSVLYCAFGAKWSAQARERLFDGVPRGVFTMTLLSALNAAFDSDGRITSDSLTHFLRNNTKSLLTPEDLVDPDVAKEPDIYESTQGRPIVFAERPATAIPRWPVTIKLPANSFGKTIEILDGRLEVVHRASAITADAVTVLLRPGLYLARLHGNANQAVFEVAGLGGVTVAL